MNLINLIHFRNWHGDLFGGLTAAIVALPLALAFGVASGAGAIAGLYGAIIVGFFAALFGGTPTQVSGPTGPMTVIATTVIATLIARYPESGLAMAFTVVMLAGLFQIGFGWLRLGQYITLMPYTVISGFMSGIGVIIILLQIPSLLGYQGPGSVVATLQQFPTYFANPNRGAISLAVLTLLIVFLMPTRLNRIIPSPLVALIVGTIVSVVWFPNADISRIGAIPQGLPNFRMPTFNPLALADMLRFGLQLAVLGAIDSLLTSLVADSISRTQHDSDRELIGQGVGNLLAGLFGGLPGAGATMRTVVNVQAGGKTPLSGMIHALTLLLVVFWAGPLTAQIPHAVLAGLLLKVGIDILDWRFIMRAPKLSIKGTGLMYLVLFLTVFVDLITAVLVGAFVANMLTIKRLTDDQNQQIKTLSHTGSGDSSISHQEQAILTAAQGDIMLLQLSGPMSFGAAKNISRRMALVQEYHALVLDLSDVPRIGVTAALAIESIVQDAIAHQRHVWIVAQSPQVLERLDKLQLHRIARSVDRLNRVDDRLQALESAQVTLSAKSPSNS